MLLCSLADTPLKIYVEITCLQKIELDLVNHLLQRESILKLAFLDKGRKKNYSMCSLNMGGQELSSLNMAGH
jgi:hypothetical protein